MKIRACIPFYNEFETNKPGLRELRDCKEIQFDIEPRQGSVVGRIRNSLFNDEKSQKIQQYPVGGYDYFLMIDSDIDFKLSHVLALIENDKDICCAPYKMHNNQELFDCGMFKPGEPGRIFNRFSTEQKGTYKVDWTGAGFMLIKAEALRAMSYPWYRHIIVKSGDEQSETSEDIGFCTNAKESNIDIWCDFDIPIGHRKRTTSDFNWNLDTGVELVGQES